MRKAFLIFFIFFCLVSPALASKESQVKKGNALYHKGDYPSSLEKYEQALKAAPESPEINFNLGTALYKSGKYTDAVSPLQKGLLSADEEVKKKVYFNLGNTFYAQGEQLADQKIDEAVSAMEESLRQFDEVIKLDDKDKDALYNHEIVKKKLEELKKKQQQQKQGQKDQKQKNESDQQKKENQNSQSDDKNNSDQQSSEQDQAENKDQNEQPKSGDQKKDRDGASDRPDTQPNDKDKKGGDRPKPGELTKEEAKMLLRQFEQDEQPNGLLNLPKGQGRDRPVIKDW